MPEIGRKTFDRIARAVRQVEGMGGGPRDIPGWREAGRARIAIALADIEPGKSGPARLANLSVNEGDAVLTEVARTGEDFDGTITVVEIGLLDEEAIIPEESPMVVERVGQHWVIIAARCEPA